MTHPHKTVLERIEHSGTIVILDKEEGDYMITVKPMSIQFVTEVLNRYVGTNNYHVKYNPDFVNWEIEFNIHGKTDLSKKSLKTDLENSIRLKEEGLVE